MIIKLICGLSVLVFLNIEVVSGLQCYVCTSRNHSACEDPFDADRAKAAMFEQTCPEPAEPGKTSLCRKTHQTVNGELRVIRSCGSHNESSTCYSTRNTEVVLVSCQCFEDLCNTASSTAGSVVLLTLSGVLLTRAF